MTIRDSKDQIRVRIFLVYHYCRVGDPSKLGVQGVEACVCFTFGDVVLRG